MLTPIGFSTLEEARDRASELPESIVWQTVLDGRYIAQVQRLDESHGTLVLFDANQAMNVMLAHEVSLSYGAAFGPDVDDVKAWQDALIVCVEALPG
jgi:hypothetical protein